VIFLLILEKFK